MIDKKIVYNLDKIETLKRNSGFIKYYLTDDLLRELALLNNEKREKKLYDSLEKIYRKKKYYFFNILEELILKGIKIYGNSNFKELSQEKFKYILDIKNSNGIIDLNWEKLGLEELIERLDIKSDLFFQGIPLERFQYFNNKLDIEEVIKFFQENKINIIKLKEENAYMNIEEKQYTVTKFLNMDKINLSLKEEKNFLDNYEIIINSSFQSFKKKYPKFIEKNSEINGKDKLKEFLKYLSKKG